MAQDLYFNYLDEGEGPALVFQHGLGADMTQVSALLSGHTGPRRLLCMECLNHGGSTLTDDPAQLSLPAFAADLEAFVDAQARQSACIWRWRDPALSPASSFSAPPGWLIRRPLICAHCWKSPTFSKLTVPGRVGNYTRAAPLFRRSMQSRLRRRRS